MFSSAERNIFKFDNGEKTVAVDPIKVHRRLVTFPGLNLGADAQAIDLWHKRLASTKADAPDSSELGRKVEQDGLAAFERVLQATRHAFNVQEFEEVDGKATGMTDAEVMALFMSFMEWMAEVRANFPTPPTSVPPTAPQS